MLAFAIGAVVLGVFFAWEAHSDHPMLDVHFFRNPRFTAASMSIMMVYFAMFGSTFLITQYFQFVLGYTPLETGIRFLPLAMCMIVIAPLSARFVDRLGTKLVVGCGLSLVTLSLVSMASLQVNSAYWPDVVWRMSLMACGMALTMAPATESIMGSLPLAKAGVGSAVNDTTRQVGGALGVAVIGSVLASVYGSQVGDFLRGKPVPSGLAADMKQSLGIALASGKQIAGLADLAKNAFVDGLHAGVLVAAGIALVGAIIAFVWLPARRLRRPVRRRGPGRRSGRRGQAHAGGRGRGGGRGGGPARRGADRGRPMTGTAMVTASRRPGRPRSPEADVAILGAAVEIFAEAGLEGLTVEGVAARAGVGKATIYRRYPCKVDLVVAAARCFTQADEAPPDTGSTRGDLRALVDALIAALTTTPLGRALPILVAARTRVPELDVAYAEIVADKRGRSAAVIRRSIERGDLRADVDPEIIVDCYVGPIFYRFLITHAPLDDEFASELVEATLRAFSE